MNGILGFAELLREDNLPESERDRYLNVIRTSGNHLLKLINDVINISRIEAGHSEINERTFNINTLLRDLFDFFKIQISRDNREIDFKYIFHFDDNSAFISADDIKIRQTLLNLLGNAYKFTETGSIEFGYSLQERSNRKYGNLLFYVKDTGIGIGTPDQKMIFDGLSQISTADRFFILLFRIKQLIKILKRYMRLL